jgi:hypothetical protein
MRTRLPIAMVGIGLAGAAAVAAAPTGSETDAPTTKYFGSIHTMSCDEKDCAVRACNKAWCGSFSRALRSMDGECTKLDARCEQADAVLSAVFGGSRQSSFPDIIVYFEHPDERGFFYEHPPVLIWNGRHTAHLYGAPYIYVLVFTEQKVELAAKATTLYQNVPNPLSGILQGLGISIGGGGSKQSSTNSSTGGKDTGSSDASNADTSGDGKSSAPKAAAKPPPQFTWYPLSGDPDRPGMWMAIARLALDQNSQDHVTISYQQPTPPTIKISGPAKSQSSTSPDGEAADPPAGTPKAIKPKKSDGKSDGADQRYSYTLEVPADEVPELDDATKKLCDPPPKDKTPPKREDRSTVTEIEELRKQLACDRAAFQPNYKGKFLAANAFFSNSFADRSAISVALGITFNERTTSAASSGNEGVNAFALAKFYLCGECRPKLPPSPNPNSSINAPSWGIVLGAKLSKSPFDEIALGIAAGHLIGNVGLVLGADVIAGASPSSGRVWRPLLAVDYTF